ncbi:MAG: HD domain-containing protein [Bacteroidota bacterium]
MHHTNHWSIDQINKAWAIATRHHDGQKYAGANDREKVEYLSHIGSVTFEVMGALPHHPAANSELALLCTLLHDTLEDTTYTYEALTRDFGKEVAEGVLALTKDEKITSKNAQLLDSLQRIKEQPEEIWMVKMADRIANLQTTPYYWNEERKADYKEGAMIIHQHLATASMYLAERLLQKIEAY